MKQGLLKFLFFFCAMLGLLGSCSKEIQTVAEESSMIQDLGISESSLTDMPSVKDNALVFANEAQLQQYLSKTSSMTTAERVQLEQRLGFESLTTIFDRVNEAEVKHQDEFFAGLSPDLSTQAYEEMGYKYERSPLFKSYLAKGVLKDIVNADGSRAFDLTIQSPYYLNAIGVGKVIQVGEGLLGFEGEQGEVMTLSNTAEGAAAGAFKITLNNQFDFVKHARRSGYESWNGAQYWIEDPAKGSNYRYYAYAKFVSTYTITSLSQTYFWAARAEQKKFGNWATRNDYNPIWGISANWSYDYWIIFTGAGFGVVRDGATYPLPNTSGNPTSPYSLSGLNTNYTVRNMYPNGLFTITGSAGYQFFENVRLYNNSYTFRFSGGCCGYDYVGQ